MFCETLVAAHVLDAYGTVFLDIALFPLGAAKLKTCGMRQNNNPRRSRHKGGNGSHNGSNGSGGGGGGGNNGNMGGQRRQVPLRNQTFDSNGPDVRIRGNAWQVHEKYVALARDAHASGDPVRAENLLQHAEHYYRLITADAPDPQRQQRFGGNYGYGEGQEDAGEGEQPEAMVIRPQMPQPQQQPQGQARQQGEANGHTNGHAVQDGRNGNVADEY